MKEDTHTKNKDNFRRHSSQASGSQHKTSVGSLLFLVFATFVLVMVTLSMASPANQNQTAHSKSNPATAKHNNLSEQDLSHLPTGLPVEGEIDIRENSHKEFGSERMQRVLILDTDQQLSSLFQAYRKWLGQSDFTVRSANRHDTGATLVGVQDRTQLVVSVSEVKGGRRVELNYTKM